VIRKYLKCSGNLNPFLSSALLLPKWGASTVKTNAENPAFSALRTSFSVNARFL